MFGPGGGLLIVCERGAEAGKEGIGPVLASRPWSLVKGIDEWCGDRCLEARRIMQRKRGQIRKDGEVAGTEFPLPIRK